MKKMIAILMTATIMMFAVTPVFADVGKEKNQQTTQIAEMKDVSFEAVYLLDLAPPILVACNVKDNIASVEDCAGYDIVSADNVISQHNQEAYICKKSPISQTTRGPAENTATINRTYDKAINRTVINQANTQAKSKDAATTTSPEDCECDIVVSFEAISNSAATDNTWQNDAPGVVKKEVVKKE